MPNAKPPSPSQDTLLVFPTDLGWMAAVVAGQTIKRLTFGHGSPAAARRAVTIGCVKRTAPKRISRLSRRSAGCPARGIYFRRRDARAPGVGAASPGLRGGTARAAGRYPHRSRPADRIPASCAPTVPPHPLWPNAQLRRTGSQGWISPSGQGRWQLHGRQSHSAGHSLPSGGVRRWPARFLLRPRRDEYETPPLGPGIAGIGLELGSVFG